MSDEKQPEVVEEPSADSRRQMLTKIGAALAATSLVAVVAGAQAQGGQIDRAGGRKDRHVIEIPKDVKLVQDRTAQGWSGNVFVAMQGGQATVAVADATDREATGRLQRATGVKGMRARVVNGVINVDMGQARTIRCIIRDVTLEGILKKPA